MLLYKAQSLRIEFLTKTSIWLSWHIQFLERVWWVYLIGYLEIQSGQMQSQAQEFGFFFSREVLKQMCWLWFKLYLCTWASFHSHRFQLRWMESVTQDDLLAASSCKPWCVQWPDLASWVSHLSQFKNSFKQRTNTMVKRILWCIQVVFRLGIIIVQAP
jgi:hypothetical protein